MTPLLSQTQATDKPQSAGSPQAPEIFYPSSDGEPLAETSVHADALINAVVTLRHYLSGQQAIVLADQFLYHSQGYPRLRVAPDVMVVFDVPPGPRDNYKIWEEDQVPAVIFEMTSEGTEERDRVFKYCLYEQLGVQEYWLFDPKGEWIPEQLRGYRLYRDLYDPITDGRSDVLQLRLEVDGTLIAFFREDTGERLPTPEDLLASLEREMSARQDAEARATQAEEQARQAEEQARQAEERALVAESEAERLRAQLRAMGVDPEAMP
jgi:Uma2 family endonuclease